MNYKKIFTIALAYVGVLTGAGLASGQEVFQYFVSFGTMGLVGVAIVAVLHMLFGRIVLALGSYYRAGEHSEVLGQITTPLVNKFLDASLIVSGFVLGFVMIAGAGANLNQEFGFPTWVGALICSLAVIVVSMMNFERVSQAIGLFTPIIVFAIIALTIYTFWDKSYDWQQLDRIALQQPVSFPNIWVSVLNYYAICMMTGAAMAFVLGGDAMYVGEAGCGGLVGGVLIGIITACTAFILLARIDFIAAADIPMQALVAEIHPWLGTLMSLIIFGMIFNTAISLYYSLAKRFSDGSEKRFKGLMIALVGIGFCLSFAGFKTLVATMFPILGYVGILLLLILSVAWFKNRKGIEEERVRRRQMFALMLKKYDEEQEFTPKHQVKLNQLVEDSVIDNHSIRQDMREMVEEEISAQNQQEKN
ncbi:putative membrane protein YkvI [Mesocricetibacter intestinalis]|uniref:Putative membrane protein YkvI n=1 Tax=Mesocricetibacter intestinalis TaxID=1521930 RepID=A0A4V3DA17_9PAST|nr:hypothetical protein [Mesocricetibacter intestinalis]TDQ59783.1 putative membrane protein YkvI [Mesocricetibacter intestinalis]